MVKHNQMFNTQAIVDYFADKGERIRYVCTTELECNCIAYDVFMRLDGPHPEFGNTYFGIRPGASNSVIITGADVVTKLYFSCIMGGDGEYHYSQHTHDYREVPGTDIHIDGGRSYVRYTFDGHPVEPKRFMVVEGEFVSA